MIEEVKAQVFKLLESDNSGHGIEHIKRVLRISLMFAESENANKEIVSLIALLHDVDDYKLFGIENSNNLTNAKNILKQCAIDDKTSNIVLESIKTIGYNKRLKGIIPLTLEGKIVSDADMCDAMGATGILRSYQYNLAHNNLFFDKDIYPVLNISADNYLSKRNRNVVNHMFEKLLNLKDLMLTTSGKNEAIERHNFMVEFLNHFFAEENVLEWSEFLDDYLKRTLKK